MADAELKQLIAHPGFQQGIAIHAKQNGIKDPIERVRAAVHHTLVTHPQLRQFSGQAAQISGRAAQLAKAAKEVVDAEEKKVPKSSVAYRPGSVSKHCGNCSMYRDHHCTLVRGVIDPSYTCKKWEAGRESGHRPDPTITAPAGIVKSARQAPDGHHYVQLPNKKYARVVQGNANSGVAQPVEQTAVNRQVAGSNPASRANPDNEKVTDLRGEDTAPKPGWATILMVRHGSTHLNSDDTSVDKIRGHIDVPLDENGKKEAAQTGDEIGRHPTKPDVIVASDLCRAKLTAKIISERTGIPIEEVSDLFRPWDAGQFSGQPSKKAVPVMAKYAEQAPDKDLPQGESFHSFMGRFFNGLSGAIQRHQGKVIAVVSHHRNERTLHSWHAAGFPADGQIHIPTFNQKGEHTGAAQVMQLPIDRVHAVAQRYRNFKKGKTLQATADERPGEE